MRYSSKVIASLVLSLLILFSLTSCGQSQNPTSETKGDATQDGTAPENAAASNVEQENIRIGLIVSLSGSGAGLGVSERQGVELAVEEINADGGVDGRKIELFIEDDESNPEIAGTKAARLINDQKVHVILGSTLTAQSTQIGNHTSRVNVPQLAFTGLGPEIEKTFPYMFHMSPPQSLNAQAMLEYATKALGASRIGVLHDTGYGTIIMNELDQLKDDYNVEFVQLEKFELEDTDMSPQLLKIQAANPDVVFIMGVSPIPFRNARELGLTQTIVSAIGVSSYAQVKAMGIGANDVVIPEFVIAEDPLPHQEAFVAAFRDRWNTDPKTFEAQGYDAVYVVAEAVKRLNKDIFTPEDLAKTIKTMTFDGVTAKYDFSAEDMTGITLDDYVYSKIIDGIYTRDPFRVR